MKSYIGLYAIIFWGLMGMQSVSAQDYRQLREAILQQQAETRSEINQIDDLISQYQRRLNQAEVKYEEIYNQYENLKRLLVLQKEKIANLQKEQRQITDEIHVTEQKLEQQEEKLETLIENYKDTMRYLYKNGRTSQLALILSSASVNQMMVRNYYLKKFETFRERQADKIRQTQNDLKQSKRQLDEAADRNTEVLAKIETEKKELQQKTNQQESNVKLLRQDKQELSNKLENQQQEKQELNSTLSNLIAREKDIRKAEQERLKQQEQENLASNIEEANTPEERALGRNAEYVGEVGFLSDAKLSEIESSFSTQRGELDWPVESNTISEHFGRQRHRVYGTLTDNLGIEIVTKSREPVKVVHAGYVFAVQPMTGFGDVIFVSHGRYKTVYGNLSRVMVKKNTILEKGDILGYSGDMNSTRGESVFFMLRAGDRNVDPEQWLKDK